MQMGEYIIEAPRMPWSWCSSYSMVAKNIVSETTWVQGPKKGVRYFIPMLSIEAKFILELIYFRNAVFKGLITVATVPDHHSNKTYW